MENQNCVLLDSSNEKQPLNGWNKYRINYSYTKESEKIDVEISVKSISMNAVFKYVNKEIFLKLGGLESAKVAVKRLLK